MLIAGMDKTEFLLFKNPILKSQYKFPLRFQESVLKQLIESKAVLYFITYIYISQYVQLSMENVQGLK